MVAGVQQRGHRHGRAPRSRCCARSTRAFVRAGDGQQHAPARSRRARVRLTRGMAGGGSGSGRIRRRGVGSSRRAGARQGRRAGETARRNARPRPCRAARRRICRARRRAWRWPGRVRRAGGRGRHQRQPVDAVDAGEGLAQLAQVAVGVVGRDQRSSVGRYVTVRQSRGCAASGGSPAARAAAGQASAAWPRAASGVQRFAEGGRDGIDQGVGIGVQGFVQAMAAPTRASCGRGARSAPRRWSAPGTGGIGACGAWPRGASRRGWCPPIARPPGFVAAHEQRAVASMASR